MTHDPAVHFPRTPPLMNQIDRLYRASLVSRVLQETFRFEDRPRALPAGAPRARSTLCALARAPRSSRSVQRTVVSVREPSPAGPGGVSAGGVSRRCCFLGGRAKPPTARERRRPRRADANMTKVPRRDVSDADREDSIRAAAPGARAFPTRSVLSPVARSDARWLAQEKKRASHHPRPRADASVPDPPRRRGLRG